MQQRTIGRNGPQVSALGLGCMGMSMNYGPAASRDEMIALIRTAVDQGVTFFDTAELYARQLSDAHSDADGREQARDRLLNYYLENAAAADAHLRALPGTPMPAVFTGRDNAFAWLDAERPSLIAAVTMAADTGRDQVAMRLPLNLAEYVAWRRRFDDWTSITMVSREAARRLHDQSYEARALTNLGNALRRVRQFEEAITAHQDAAAIFRETGDRHSEDLALNNLESDRAAQRT